MNAEQLKQITPLLNYDKTLELFNKYDITTPQRQAMFLAQCAHESGNFKYKEENLNYSANSLKKVFKKYFPTDDLANKYARKPVEIASRVYANRMNNGDEKSQDGWRYRGRGLIQLTGKANYTLFAKSINKPLDDELIKYLSTDEGALHSALYFWDREKLNSYADKGDVRGCTKRINGGFNGLEDRTIRYNEAVKIMELGDDIPDDFDEFLKIFNQNEEEMAIETFNLYIDILK